MVGGGTTLFEHSCLEVSGAQAGSKPQPTPIQLLQPAIASEPWWGRHAVEVGCSFLLFSLFFALLGMRRQAPSPRTVLLLHDVW